MSKEIRRQATLVVLTCMYVDDKENGKEGKEKRKKNECTCSCM